MANEVHIDKVAMQIFGITASRYRQMAKDAIVPPVNKGMIDFPLAVKQYVEYLKKLAKGQGSISLTDERTRLATTQANKLELEYQIALREYAPINIITQTMASVGRQIAGILEALPVKLKREAKLKVKQYKIVEREIAKARNVAAEVTPEWDKIDTNGENDPANNK